MDKKEIGARIAALRGNISRETLAKEIGVSVSAIQMYESGERIPRDEIKVKIAKYFNCSVQNIFFENINHETWFWMVLSNERRNRMNRITREPKGTVRINGAVIKDAKIISAEINPDYTADVLISVKADELFFNYTAKEEAAAELEETKTATVSEYFNL